MKKIAIVLLCLAPATARAGDCSSTKTDKDWIDVVNLGAIQFYGDLDCLERQHLSLKSTQFGLKAVAVVGHYTIFSMGGRLNPIAVKGGHFDERQPLPQGDYRYLGTQSFAKANGFTVDLPVIEPK